MASEGLSDANSPPPHTRFSQDVFDKLSEDQIPLYLLTLASSITSFVSSLRRDQVLLYQILLQSELLLLISIPSHPPGRNLRNTVSLGVEMIFRNGGSIQGGLVQELVHLLEGVKDPDRGSSCRAASIARRQASALCLGALVRSSGSEAGQVVNVIAAALFRQLKSSLSKNHSGYRGALLHALFQSFQSRAAMAVDVAIARSVWKLSRAIVLTDKSDYVRIRALNCIGACFCSLPYFKDLRHYRKLYALFFKMLSSLSDADAPLFPRSAWRRALAAWWVTCMLQQSPTLPGSACEAVLSIQSFHNKHDTGTPTVIEPVLPSISDLLSDLCSLFFQFPANSARSAVAQTFAMLIDSMPDTLLHQHFALVMRAVLRFASPAHITSLSDAGAHSNATYLSHYLAIQLLRHLFSRLTEAAQLSALKSLIQHIREVPDATGLTFQPMQVTLALSGISDLLCSIGPAAFSVSTDLLSLLTFLEGRSDSVQIYTASMACQLILTQPDSLPARIAYLVNELEQEVLCSVSSSRGGRRCLGLSVHIASALSLCRYFPLQGPTELYHRIFLISTRLLKSAASYDIPTSALVIRVAWLLLSGLLCLSSDFVTPLVGQLMALWRNALPKPVRRDDLVHRSQCELTFLVYVRECALGALRIFLTLHPQLSDGDVGRRIGSLVSNTIAFLRCVEPHDKPLCSGTQASPPSDSILDSQAAFSDASRHWYVLLARHHTIHCARAVAGLGWNESSAAQVSIGMFCGSGNSEAFSSGDSCETSGCSSCFLPGPVSNALVRHCLNSSPDGYPSRGVESLRILDERHTIYDHLDALAKQALVIVPEHDVASFLLYPVDTLSKLSLSVSISQTSTVDSAVQYFARSFPHLLEPVQESLLEQIRLALTSLPHHSNVRSFGFAHLNVAAFLVLVCKEAKDLFAESNGFDHKVVVIMLSLLHELLLSSDALIRQLAALALGSLCSSLPVLLDSEVSLAVDTIVSTPDPSVRAGYASALGRMICQSSILPAGRHMKAVVSLLNTLIFDSHPVVHFWALDALALVVETAGQAMGHAGVVTLLHLIGTLGGLDGHGVDTNGLAPELSAVSAHVAVDWANRELEWETSVVLLSVIEAIIRSIGPTLREGEDIYVLIASILRSVEADMHSNLCPPSYFDRVPSAFLPLPHSQGGFGHVYELLSLCILSCHQQIYLFAPDKLDFGDYLRGILSGLQLSSRTKAVAIQGLHDLLRRDGCRALSVPSFETNLWSILDRQNQCNLGCKIPTIGDNSRPLSRLSLSTIILESAQDFPCAIADWVAKCEQMILGKSTPASTYLSVPCSSSAVLDLKRNAGDVDDETSAFTTFRFFGSSGSNVQLGENLMPGYLNSSSNSWRWSTKVLILRCLLAVIRPTFESRHFVPESFTDSIPSLVNLAFSACTSNIPLLRSEGLLLLSICLSSFAAFRDPDFDRTSILEQHSAQIDSAILSTITYPSIAPHDMSNSHFATDVLGSATGTLVAAQFVCANIVQDPISASRVFQFLYSTLTDASWLASTSSHCPAYSCTTTPAAREILHFLSLVAWGQMLIFSMNEPGGAFLSSCFKGSSSPVPILIPLWIDAIRRTYATPSSPTVSACNCHSITGVANCMDMLKVGPSDSHIRPVFEVGGATLLHALLLVSGFDGEAWVTDDHSSSSPGTSSVKDSEVCYFFPQAALTSKYKFRSIFHALLGAATFQVLPSSVPRPPSSECVKPLTDFMIGRLQSHFSKFFYKRSGPAYTEPHPPSPTELTVDPVYASSCFIILRLFSSALPLRVLAVPTYKMFDETLQVLFASTRLTSLLPLSAPDDSDRPLPTVQLQYLHLLLDSVDSLQGMYGRLPLEDGHDLLQELFNCCHLVVFVLTQLKFPLTMSSSQNPFEIVALGLHTLFKIIQHFPNPIKSDLLICVMELLLDGLSARSGMSLVSTWKIAVEMLLSTFSEGSLLQRISSSGVNKILERILVTAQRSHLRTRPYDSERECAALMWAGVVFIRLILCGGSQSLVNDPECAQVDEQYTLDVLWPLASKYNLCLIAALENSATARIAAGCVQRLLRALCINSPLASNPVSLNSLRHLMGANLIPYLLRYVALPPVGLMNSDLSAAQECVCSGLVDWAVQNSLIEQFCSDRCLSLSFVPLSLVLTTLVSRAVRVSAIRPEFLRLSHHVLKLAEQREAFRIAFQTLSPLHRQLLESLVNPVSRVPVHGLSIEDNSDVTGNHGVFGSSSDRGVQLGPKIELKLTFTGSSDLP